MIDFEKLGVFYLGRVFDPETRQTTEEPLLYEAKDLTTHAVCVGMTGSGKTGLGIGLIEEAALDGIPALVIDPKGDLGNLLLTFPHLAASDFRPWVDEGEAARKQMSPDDFAVKTAEIWTQGLARWGQDGARIARLKAPPISRSTRPVPARGCRCRSCPRLPRRRRASPPTMPRCATAYPRPCPACWRSSAWKPTRSSRANTSCWPPSSSANGARAGTSICWR